MRPTSHPLRCLVLAFVCLATAAWAQGETHAEINAGAAPVAVEQASHAAHGEISQADPAAAGHAEEHAHHGLPTAPPILAELGWFKITNSMVTMWVVALGLITVAQLATRKMSAVPTGLQNLVEAVVEGLQGLLEGILGKELARKTYWFFATIFIFILCANWFGLVPGVDSIGGGVPAQEGSIWLKTVTSPLFRGANADLNMTLGMSAVFMIMWFVWSIQSAGVGGFIKHIFWPAKDKMSTGMMLILAGPFIFAGLLEVISIAFRPVSLSFRLYGNIFAGENLLETMITISPKLGWLAAIPFYFMELLVGAVQALVFMLLTAVFTGLMCAHGDDHHDAGHGEKAHH